MSFLRRLFGKPNPEPEPAPQPEREFVPPSSPSDSEQPGSWRAQLQDARAALDAGDLEWALSHYEQCLEEAGELAPADALQQITADLGMHGYTTEAVELVSPLYDFEQHGLQVGNNLIKAYYDLGQIDHARSLLTQLESLQRPEYQERLDHWEDVLSKADHQTRSEPNQEALQIQAIPVSGPIWLTQDHPIAEHFPQKAPDAPLIAFTGGSTDRLHTPTRITAEQDDSPERFSRALPLYLSERIHLETRLRSRAPIPIFVNHGGGFLVITGETSPDKVAHLARLAAGPTDTDNIADFAFDAHLETRGENWTLRFRFIRTIDAEVIAKLEYKFPENGFHHIARQVLEDIYATIAREAEIAIDPTPPPHTQIEGQEIDHYLLRLEQSLGARCALNLESSQSFLPNPAEVISGVIQLCIQNSDHLPSRFILWRTLDATRQILPDLTQSFSETVVALQKDHPIDHPAFMILTKEIEGVFTDG